MQFRKVFDVVRNLAFILILDSFSVFAAAQYGNIPPLLTKINNDSIELNALIAIDPVGNCEKVNSMNEELLRDINLFLKKHTTKLPSPYTIHLCFCEKANVTITEKDQVQLDEQWALKCHLKGTCEAAWITRYEYDLATKKKKHLDSWLHTSWNIPLNFTVESFSGWVLVMTNRGDVIKSPITGYEFLPLDDPNKCYYVQILPEFDLSGKITQYGISAALPQVFFTPAIRPNNEWVPNCICG